MLQSYYRVRHSVCVTLGECVFFPVSGAGTISRFASEGSLRPLGMTRQRLVDANAVYPLTLLYKSHLMKLRFVYLDDTSHDESHPVYIRLQLAVVCFTAY